MHGVLPTVESGKPVKQQVEGLLAFAEALHRNHRADAKFRARRWSRAAARRDDQDGDAVSPRPESVLAAQGEPTSREVPPRGGSDEDLPTRPGRFDSGDGSSDEELELRKKGTGRNLPKLSPSIRANKLQLAEELLGEEDLSMAEAQVLVEKYRKRNRAAEAAVQASVERFHRGRKQQEPLLDDLKTLKKVIADKNRHLHLLEGLGIRQFIKHKASHWEDGNTRVSSRSSARTPPEWPPISKKSGDERRPSFTRSRDVDVWSLRTNSKDSTGRRQAESPELSPEEEEERLLALAEDLASKELAQSLRLRRSPGLRPKGVEQKNADWLHGLHRKRRRSGAAHDLTLQEPRHRLQRAPRCLQPLSEKDLAARRIGNVVFWHSSAWPSFLRRVAKAKEVRRLEEVPDPSLPQHPFVIGEHKQVDEVRTLRLDEAGEVPSSSSSSSSSSVSPKEKLAKSCLKPWRSPVEAYLGKSFIFPQRRGSARASELLGASMHKSGSQKTAERTVAPVAQEEEAEVTATSHSAWEKIKRTHGFAALCHAHPRNDR